MILNIQRLKVNMLYVQILNVNTRILEDDNEEKKDDK